MELCTDWKQIDKLKLSLLLDESFKISNYMSNYPHIFFTYNFAIPVLLYNNEDYIAFCTLHQNSWYLNHNLIKGICVGSVAVNLAYRKKYLGIKIMEYAEIIAKHKFYDFIYLFTDLTGFYNKLNYNNSSIEYFTMFYKKNLFLQKDFFKINKEKDNYKLIIKQTTTLTLNECQHIWQFIVKNSRSNENILNWQEFLQVIKIPNMQIFLLFIKNFNEIINMQACCFLGKGNDFLHTAHGLYFNTEKDIIILIYKLIYQYLKNNDILNIMLPNKEFGLNYFSIVETKGAFYKNISNKITDMELNTLFENQFLYPRTILSS